jgi:hypothetical protein
MGKRPREKVSALKAAVLLQPVRAGLQAIAVQVDTAMRLAPITIYRETNVK